MKFIPVDKMSKKEKKKYYSQKRGEPIPPTKIGKTSYDYKKRKRELKEAV